MNRRWILILGAAIPAFVIACEDDDDPVGPRGREAFARYVALGTSVSAGAASGGIMDTTQFYSWPRQLAALANSDFTQPYIARPGCPPPYRSPLATGVRIDGSAISPTPATCSANVAGITLPTQNLSVPSILTAQAVAARPGDAGTPPVMARIIPAGQSVLSSMRAQNPTLVSVELGANEVLNAAAGIAAPPVLFDTTQWRIAYARVIDTVRATGSMGLLVSLPADGSRLAAFRRGSEIHADSATFLNSFYVLVTGDCAAGTGANRDNLLYVPGKVMTAVAEASVRFNSNPRLPPATLSCADTPGQPDFVLTPTDLTRINAHLTFMNTVIRNKADSSGYATFSMDTIYAAPKAAFRITTLLTTATPYGPYMSLDGVTPNVEGQRVMARAAARAIDRKYGFTITPSVQLARTTRE